MQVLTMFNKVVAYNEHGYTPVGNAAICAATGECHKDVLITTVDCVPTDIDYYDYYYINGKFIKGGPKSELRETNNNDKMSFWIGTKAEYEAIPQESIIENCLYITTDDTLLEDIHTMRKNLEEGKYVPNRAMCADELDMTLVIVEAEDFYLREDGLYCIVVRGSGVTTYTVMLFYQLGKVCYGSTSVRGNERVTVTANSSGKVSAALTVEGSASSSLVVDGYFKIGSFG